MVEYIIIGGEKRPVKFGFAALIKFEKLTGKRIGAEANYSLSELMHLFYCGLEDGARSTKAAFPFSWEDVADWFDGDPESELITKMMEILQRQQAQPKKKASEAASQKQ